MRPPREVARVRKDTVFGDGVFRWPGWRAWDEGVSSQDEALVFQGVLPGAAGDTGGVAGCRAVLALSMRETSEDGLAVYKGKYRGGDGACANAAR